MRHPPVANYAAHAAGIGVLAGDAHKGAQFVATLGSVYGILDRGPVVYVGSRFLAFRCCWGTGPRRCHWLTGWFPLLVPQPVWDTQTHNH